MKHILLFSAAMLLSVSLFAQSEGDALRFSRNDITGGTARGMAMAGAFGALGGDVTGIAVNPAGIGVYRSSEVLATLNFENVGTKTDMSNNKFKFNFDNLAYVGYFPTGDDTFKGFQFGFSYNRLNNFDRNYSTIGKGLGGSLTDYMAFEANEFGAVEGNLGISSDDLFWPFRNGQKWLPTFGYNAYLIDPPGTQDPNSYRSILRDIDLVNNDLLVEERGSVSAYDFTLGTSIADFLSLGMTLSITDINYRMYSSYFEHFDDRGSLTDRHFELANWMETNGTGYGVKVGAIFRPINELRIGIAYHSPTWYDLSDTYSASIFHNNIYAAGDVTPNNGTAPGNEVFRPRYYPNEGRELLESSEFYYDYKLKTPYKWVFSLAGVIEDWAILSLDYELKDYSGMDFSAFDGASSEYRDINLTMDSHYRLASTVKFGAEFRLTPQFSVRGGFAWAQSPLETEFKKGEGVLGETSVAIAGSIPHYQLDDDTFYYTFGFGYRFTPQFYVDIASVVKTQDSDLFAFPRIQDGSFLIDSTPVSMSTRTFKGLVTVGYKF